MKGLGIVGGGHAAIGLARTLKEGGFVEPIEIFDKSNFAPYERPPLSKQALEENLDPKDFGLASHEELLSLGIHLRTGVGVKQVSKTTDLFSVRTDKGDSRHFSRLVLATGVRPRRLSLAVNPLTPVCYLQSLEDLLRIRSHLKSSKRVLIVGAGFIGLESASSLCNQGHEVLVVERGEQVMNRALGSQTASFFQSKLEAMGVQILLEETIEDIHFESNRNDSRFLFTSGREFVADLVIVSIGVEPVTDYINLEVKMSGDHVLVDQEGATTVPGLFAIGDIAARPNPQNPGELVKIQSIDAAALAAQRLADHLLGAEPGDYSLWLPRFWSEQAGHKLQIAGLKPSVAQVAKRGDLSSDSFSIGYLVEGRLVAVECVNAPVDFLNSRKLIQSGVQIDPASFSDTSTNLKTLAQL